MLPPFFLTDGNIIIFPYFSCPFFQGTGVGELRNPSDPASQGLKPKQDQLLKKTKKSQEEEEGNGGDGNAIPATNKRLHFSVSLSGARSVSVPSWDAVLWRGRLYVEASAGALSAGSRRAFVSMLEHAEEELGCDHVVVIVDKENATPDVVRNFLFLGFQALPPGHEFLPDKQNVVSRTDFHIR